MYAALPPILPVTANVVLRIVFASGAHTPRDSLSPSLKANTIDEKAIAALK